jgi:hypothetical protein
MCTMNACPEWLAVDAGEPRLSDHDPNVRCVIALTDGFTKHPRRNTVAVPSLRTTVRGLTTDEDTP